MTIQMTDAEFPTIHLQLYYMTFKHNLTSASDWFLFFDFFFVALLDSAGLSLWTFPVFEENSLEAHNF